MIRTKWRAASLVTLAGTMAVAASATSYASTKHPAKKKLSQTSVTFSSVANEDSVVYYMADQLGYFKQQGLNVDFQDPVGAGGPALLTAFLAGAYDFLNVPASGALIGAQNGAAIKAIMTTNISQQLEITLSTAAAHAAGVPLQTATAAQSLKQFKSLKGSHVLIGASSITSTGYVDIVVLCKTYGLSCAVNAPSDDINIQTTGTVGAYQAAFGAGKLGGMVGPASSVQANNSVTINLGNIVPISTAPSLELLTTPAMIKNHPDTVQAVVTACVKAWAHAKKFPKAALRYTQKLEAINGITSTDEDLYLYNDFAKYWKTPLLVRAAYTSMLRQTNLAGPTVITLGYSAFNAPQFVNKAVKTLGLKVPNKV